MKVVFEDDVILVVEKPTGVPCLPARRGDSRIAPTLASILVEHDPFLAMLPDFGIAHRLDNDTSGLMVVAKTNDALVLLSQQFRSPSPLPSRERERERGQFAVKEYTALVLGSPPNGGAIDDPIAHHPRKKAKMIVDDEGRPAKTDYTVTQRYRDYSLLTVTIATGVRHQIRVHLASAGFPLAGDRLYQNPKKRAIDTLPLQRHFLHASRLTITHPVTGKRRTWTSKLPDDLTTILSELS